jgi:hypothetical protein
MWTKGNFGLQEDQRPLLLKVKDWSSSLAFGAAAYEEIPMEGGIEDDILDEVINIDQDGPICTGAGAGYALEILQARETGRMQKFSATDLYNHNKQIDGLPAGMEGSTLWASAETARVVGAIFEYLFPSTPENIGAPKVRSDSEVKLGKFNSARAFVKCETLNDVLIALANKYPVLFGMYVFESYGQAPNGIVPVLMSGSGLGGHEMCAVRYSRETRRIKVPQSWGIDTRYTDKKGFQYIPFEHFMPVWEGPTLKKTYFGEMYALLDFIPAGATALPKTINVLPEVIRVRVNGVDVDLSTLQIPPWIASNIGKTFIYIRDLAPILKAMLAGAGYSETPTVEWNQKDKAVEIKV